MKLSKKKVRYSTLIKAVAVNALLVCGKNGYNFLRQLLPLPCLNTVRASMDKIQRQPGIHPANLQLVKNKYNLAKKKDKMCFLLIDEMSLKKGFSYCQLTGSFAGFEDDGTTRTKRPATSALVVMAVGYIKKWKTPLGYILAENSASYSKIIQIIKDAITAIECEGFSVHGITSDQGPNIERAFREMGATVDDPQVKFNNNSYFVYKDPPHLLKNARNFLLKGHVIMPDGQPPAKWTHLMQLYNKECNRSLKFAPRLTRKHLYDLKFQNKMKVKLAVQVLSHSTSTYIKYLVHKNKMPKDSLATSKYCKLFNDLFDIFNSGTFKCKVPLRRALKTDETQTVLNNYIKFLEDLQHLNKKRGVKFIKGWLQNINVLLKLGPFLNSQGITHLKTRNLCQDPLENFFGRIRYKQKVPTARQFSLFYANIAGSSLLRPSSATNCEEEVDSSAETVNALDHLLKGVGI